MVIIHHMRKLLAASLVGCATGAAFTSCIDYDDVTREVSVDIQLVMPEEFTQGSDMEGHTGCRLCCGLCWWHGW